MTNIRILNLASIAGRLHLYRFTLITGCLILTLSACSTPQIILPPGTIAPDFTLKDQYDTEFCMTQFRGENVLLLGCDKEGVDGSGEWLRLFNERYTDRLRVLPLFNASSLPLFARLLLKGKIKTELQRSPDKPEVPNILLDWDGKVSRQYGMHPKNCTVVLIDQFGRIQLVAPLEQIESEEASVMLGQIDQLIKQ